jgi:fibronectin-binding autotransporter adhesin
MTAYTWTGVTGNWKTAGDWTPVGGPPTASDSATINGSASFTVTVNSADVADSLTLSDANATLNDDGVSASLTIGGTLAMSNGTLNVATSSADSGTLTVGALTLSGGALNVDSGGQLNLRGTLSQTGGTLTLQGGTIKSTAGTVAFTSSGGTLSGVTYDGTLNLSGFEVSVQLASGTVVNNAAGTSAGTINDTGEDSGLTFANTQTFDNATINLGSTVGGQDIGFSGGGTLHLLGPTTFYGEISNFAAGDTVELKGSWAFSSISEAGGLTTLTLASGATTHGFQFVGDYTQGDFAIKSGTTTKSTFT